MNWYLAKMIFRIVCGEGGHTPQFDEQLRLVKADNLEEAFTKAAAMGQLEEDTFTNQRDQPVRWQFINISELYKLSELIDGAELYSRIEERENGDAYIYMVNQRAENILSSTNAELFQLT